MPDIIVAADETAASNLVHAAETTLGTVTQSGWGALDPSTPPTVRAHPFPEE